MSPERIVYRRKRQPSTIARNRTQEHVRSVERMDVIWWEGGRLFSPVHSAEDIGFGESDLTDNRVDAVAIGFAVGLTNRETERGSPHDWGEKGHASLWFAIQDVTRSERF